MIPSMVKFVVGMSLYPVGPEVSTALSESLLLAARDAAGTKGRAGALALHHAIEDVLTDAADAPIPLGGAAAEAAYYILTVSLDRTMRDDPAFALYYALTETHESLKAVEWVEPLFCVECGRSPKEDEAAEYWHTERALGLTSRTCPECWRSGIHRRA
jgi:hypothetical protein